MIGAIYLDSEVDSVRRFILRVAGDDLSSLARAPTEDNPKGELQEVLQAVSSTGPTYEVISEAGPDHLKEFHCRVIWEDRSLGQGTGQSKKQAEINAAIQALQGRRWEASPKIEDKPN